MPLDLDDDLACVDGAATVTVRLKRAAGNVEIECTAVKGAVDRKTLAAGGVQLAGNETGWELPSDEFAAAGDEPKEGDEIEEADGTRWRLSGAVRLPVAAGFAGAAVKVR